MPETSSERQRISPYRREALDRLTSPEQLDQLMITTRLQGWLALAALLLLLLVGGVWAAYGEITTEVVGQGVALAAAGSASEIEPETEWTGQDTRAILFFPLTASYQLEPGMEVRLFAWGSTVSQECWPGRVLHVGETPTSTATMRAVLQDDDLVRRWRQSAPLSRVLVEGPVPGDVCPRGAERWQLVDGALVAGDVVVRRERPAEVFLPALRRAGR